jgi:hypothetical protein
MESYFSALCAWLVFNRDDWIMKLAVAFLRGFYHADRPNSRRVDWDVIYK